MEEVFDAKVEALLLLRDGDDPPLQEMQACKVVDRTSLSAMLKHLSNSSLPPYLKRVRHDNTAEYSLVLLTQMESTLECVQQFPLVPQLVPSVAPVTTNQAKSWSTQFWPVAFASQRLLPQLVPLFSTQEEVYLALWMKSVIEDHSRVVIADSKTSESVAIVQDKTNHPVLLALERVAAKANPTSQDYLCTGLDVFLPTEPCVMCAMALLHARVSRVFFHHTNPTSGALKSVVRLHTLENINHRYRVFVGFKLPGLNSAPSENHGCFAECDSS